MNATFFVARHAQPTEDAQNITHLGREQIFATADAHLRTYPYFDNVASSGAIRARKTFAYGLLAHCTQLTGIVEYQELSLSHAVFNPTIPAQLTSSPISEQNARELYGKHGRFAVYRFRMLNLMECTIRAVHSHESAQAHPRDIVCLWVSHNEVIESILTPDRNEMDFLGHADMLKVVWNVQWMNNHLQYQIESTEVLRCPIPSR